MRIRALVYDPPEERQAMQALSALCITTGVDVKYISPRPYKKSVLPLSSAQYTNQFGDDLDFVAISLSASSNQTTRRKFLNLESRFYKRLRGIAAKIDNDISNFRPSIAIVSSCMQPISLLMMAKALKYKIPLLFFRGNVIPGGAIVLDRFAPFFLPGITEMEVEWKKHRSLSVNDEKEADDFLEQWRITHEEFLSHGKNIQEVRLLENFISRDSRPVLLFAQQGFDVAADFQVPIGFDNYTNWVKAFLDAVPKTWKVIIKTHPSDFSSIAFKFPISENQITLSKTHLHHLIRYSDCIATMTSKAGIEATLIGKPVIVCGRTFYSKKNITIDMYPDPGVGYNNSLPQKLVESLEWSPPKEFMRRFVKKIILDYFIWPGQTEKFRLRLSEAIDSPPFMLGDIRRPLFDFFPKKLQAYARAINDIAVVGEFEGPISYSVSLFQRKKQKLMASVRKRIHSLF